MPERSTSLALAISVLANLAVLAGLLFLVVQIRQTNETIAIESNWNERALYSSWQGRVSENPELASAIHLAEVDPQSVTDEQKVQLRFWIAELTMLVWAQANLYEEGVYEESNFLSRLEVLCRYRADPVLGKYVENLRGDGKGSLWKYVDDHCD